MEHAQEPAGVPAHQKSNGRALEQAAAAPQQAAVATPPRTMQAVVRTEYGPPEVLHVATLEVPAPKPGELLIEVKAAEATKADCELRSFHFPVRWFWLPLRAAVGVRRPRRSVLGGYFSGVVAALGEGAVGFELGDAVFGSTGLRMGAYGQYMALPATATVARKPSNLSFEEAAAVPLGGLNALHFLRKAAIEPGQRVLVNGAGGSIGTFGVQIAKSMGAEVTAVDSGLKQELLRSLGADHFVDYREQDFTQTGQKYDVIFDMVVGSSYRACVRALKPKGRYLMGNPRLSDMVRAVATSRFTSKQASFAFAGETVEELTTLRGMLERGELRAPVHRVLARHEASEAHRLVETEQRVGAVVLSHSP